MAAVISALLTDEVKENGVFRILEAETLSPGLDARSIFPVTFCSTAAIKLIKIQKQVTTVGLYICYIYLSVTKHTRTVQTISFSADRSECGWVDMHQGY